jgi:hypothetical protein
MGGKIPNEKLMFSRLNSYFNPWQRTLNSFHSFLTRNLIGNFLLSKLNEMTDADVRETQKLRRQDNNPLYSPYPFPKYSGYAGVVLTTFHEALEDKFNCKVGTYIARIDGSKTVYFADGSSDKFDIIICGTGFRHGFPFLSVEDCKRYGVPSKRKKDFESEIQESAKGNFQEAIRLYRCMIPVEDQTIVFHLFNLNLDAFLTAEVGAHWISDVFSKRINLPTKEAMNNSIDGFLKQQSEAVKPNGWTGMCVMTAIFNWTWDILLDMELDYPRKPTFFKEHFETFTAADFKTLHEERKLRDEFKRLGRRYRGPYGSSYKSLSYYAIAGAVYMLALAFLVSFISRIISQ